MEQNIKRIKVKCNFKETKSAVGTKMLKNWDECYSNMEITTRNQPENLKQNCLSSWRNSLAWALVLKRENETHNLFVRYQFVHEHKILKWSKQIILLLPTIDIKKENSESIMLVNNKSSLPVCVLWSVLEGIFKFWAAVTWKEQYDNIALVLNTHDNWFSEFYKQINQQIKQTKKTPALYNQNNCSPWVLRATKSL